MNSDPEDADEQPAVGEAVDPQKSPTAYTVIKWLAILLLGIPLGLIAVAALVFGICMLAMN